jgi:hypothetical protein
MERVQEGEKARFLEKQRVERDGTVREFAEKFLIFYYYSWLDLGFSLIFSTFFFNVAQSVTKSALSPFGWYGVAETTTLGWSGHSKNPTFFPQKPPKKKNPT